MDPQAQIIAGLIVGYVMQWARAFKRIPDPVVYLLAFAAGVVIFYLASPNVSLLHRTDWWSAVLFLFTIRGVAGIAGDAKAAPKSNTL